MLHSSQEKALMMKHSPEVFSLTQDLGAAEYTLTLEQRFPNTRAFFRYHASKAKLCRLGMNTYYHGHIAWQLQEEVDLEWCSMDLITESEWAELRMRLVIGNRRYLRSYSTAHLFRKGCARSIPWDGFGPRGRRKKNWAVKLALTDGCEHLDHSSILDSQEYTQCELEHSNDNSFR